MKRIIAAVAFSALAVPALADNRPFKQTELDRALPNVAEREPQDGSRQAVTWLERYAI